MIRLTQGCDHRFGGGINGYCCKLESALPASRACGERRI